MNHIFDKPADPFAQTDAVHPIIHLRLQTRTTRKSFTLVEGLSMDNCAKLLQPLRKELCTSVSITADGVLKLQGDHRMTIAAKLVEGGYTTFDKIHVHGK